jgi:hypothetical protein
VRIRTERGDRTTKEGGRAFRPDSFFRALRPVCSRNDRGPISRVTRRMLRFFLRSYVRFMKVGRSTDVPSSVNCVIDASGSARDSTDVMAIKAPRIYGVDIQAKL